jgi:hypothetical protein
MELGLRFQIIETISDPGDSDDENEDRFGWNASAVIVIDGATPLGPPLLMPPRSDAAWLAEFARDFLLRKLPSALSGREIVRSLSTAAREYFYSHVHGEIRLYEHPVAAFQTLRIRGNGLETMGLADCTLFIRDALGQCTRWSGTTSDRSSEREASKRAGGVGALNDERVLAALRSQRSIYNTEKGPWTLGLEPAAADHVLVNSLVVRLPALAILCTDGFAAAVDSYELFSSDSMINAAESGGLGSVLREIRHTERRIDPDGSRFPRFKQSDDATAVLFSVQQDC